MRTLWRWIVQVFCEHDWTKVVYNELHGYTRYCRKCGKHEMHM